MPVQVVEAEVLQVVWRKVRLVGGTIRGRRGKPMAVRSEVAVRVLLEGLGPSQ